MGFIHDRMFALMRTFFLTLGMITATACTLTAQVVFPGTAPDAAAASTTGTHATIGNKLFSAEFKTSGNGLIFDGMKTASGEQVLDGNTDIFTINLKDGSQLTSGSMTVKNLRATNLTADDKSVKYASGIPGKALRATFSDVQSGVTVEWEAELRDGSHYLRQEFTIKASKDTYFKDLVPMQYHFSPHGETVISGNTTHGTLVHNDLVFAGLETPMSVMSVGNTGSAVETTWTPTSWVPASFGDVFLEPESFEKKYGHAYSEKVGPIARYLKVAEGEAQFDQAGECKIRFQYKSGTHKLNILGVQLTTDSGKVLSEDIHKAHVGTRMVNNEYRINVPAPGVYHLRYWVETKTESITSSGAITFSIPVSIPQEEEAAGTPENLVRGTWVRKAALSKGNQWKVSSVVGFFAPEQQRRSLLAYIERERPVPYRPFIHHNDWYEIGITCNNSPNAANRHSEPKSLEVIKAWEKEMFLKRKVSIDAFVLDDGWDDFNSLWGFHSGFPRGFTNINKQATKQKAGIGTWLGPVGGYGAAKRMRLGFWNKTHPNNKIDNFQLSNKEYFDAFVGRCSQMVRDYDMRYFKFDGISAKYHAKGPANEEDAEGILNVLAALRKARPDLYINTTVGTWASPFWLLHSDAVWRQRDDFDRAGKVGDPRDRWITYRDRLVHEVFVQGSPLMPINSIMTHGLIITKNGPPRVMSKEPANCIKEMRAAFGCGSSLVELYVDRDLMNQENGRLWDELASCIKWIRRNADVLADIHWVGGNPWDGQDGSIYGWAAWNKSKCTLTLRNSSATEKTLSTTLREVMDVPPSWQGHIQLKNSFADQRILEGITDTAVDVNTPINFTIKPFEVIVMEGINTETEAR